MLVLPLPALTFPLILRGDAFEHAHAGRADGNDALSGFFCFIYGKGRFFTEFKSFRVHLVFRERFSFHRRKCPEADMQGDKANFHAARANFIQQFFREMQTGGRRGHGAGRPGEHGLITVPVLGLQMAAFNIGRQGNFAQ